MPSSIYSNPLIRITSSASGLVSWTCAIAITPICESMFSWELFHQSDLPRWPLRFVFAFFFACYFSSSTNHTCSFLNVVTFWRLVSPRARKIPQLCSLRYWTAKVVCLSSVRYAPCYQCPVCCKTDTSSCGPWMLKCAVLVKNFKCVCACVFGLKVYLMSMVALLWRAKILPLLLWKRIKSAYC